MNKLFKVRVVALLVLLVFTTGLYFGESVSLKNYVLVTVNSKVKIMDFSDPMYPEEVSQFYAKTANRSYVNGNYVYVTAKKNGLMIFDISDLTNPKQVATVNTNGETYALYIRDNYAYVVNKKRFFVIFDISNPESPKQISQLELLSNTNSSIRMADIWVEGKYAYVACKSDGFVIIDVSNPKSPKLVRIINNKEFFDNDSDSFAVTVGIYAKKDYLYMIDWRFELVVYKISKPTKPRPVTNLELGEGSVNDIFVKGKYAYISLNKGVAVVDISNPKKPKKIVMYKTNDSVPGKVYVLGNYAYVPVGYKLEIVDISNIKRPKKVKTLKLDGYGPRVTGLGE
ncbi:hypothetical protein BG95_08645 [Thermosipho sp. 1063]|uniref:LVIVD repeat-containing protein n=1 Tax=unclassified Thermosipho (in: thermotogales) TaxID=2676525 RepID=UPI0009493D9D|nr:MULTISPECIES: hypothetical protein [unclassified Thermosipho (in: thermotogales)]ANQ54683.1 hypothetical protein Y592_08750 [Thermosipho sp. 1070]APT73074.1 hypothetical protein BG95_08645 [Thermosipho sp. 1063]OOC42337.1 hypothetical protein XO08_08700 [Thermosipho sp. 1074]